MSDKETTIKDWVRGGQIIDHNIRMFKQIAKKVMFVSLFFAFVYISVYTFFNTTSFQRKLAFNYYYSYFMNGIGASKGINHFSRVNGSVLKLKHPQVINSQTFKVGAKGFEAVVVSSALQSILIILCSYFLISFYIRYCGRKQQNDKFVRGGQIVTNEVFINSLKSKQINKSLSLGVVPILKDAEVLHIEVSGSPGTGKSQTLKHLIADIKRRGDRAIVYSASDEFIADFYDAEKDIILNPLDDRSPDWSIWNETQEIYHYDDLAAALIPEVEGGQNDPFWINTARSLLSNTARKLKDKGNYSTKILLDKLLNINLKEIANLVKNTESATVFADGAEKTALSVRATLLSNIKSLKFLTNQSGGFSIREWVTDEKNHNGACVFITSKNDQKEVLKPLISCWIDVFSSSILSLPENRSRRIWLIIDELPSLHKLKSLQELLAQSRKYGCCVVLGYQGYSQVEEIYGPKGALSLSNLTATKLFFRNNSQFNAKHASDELGREEIKATNENISVSAEQIRDSVSMSEQEKIRELVLPTQIINLDDLHGFYRLPGNMPVVSFKQKLHLKDSIADGFVPSTKANHIFMLEDKLLDGQEPYQADNSLNESTGGEPPSWVTEEIDDTNKHLPQPNLDFGSTNTDNKKHKNPKALLKPGVMQRGLS